MDCANDGDGRDHRAIDWEALWLDAEGPELQSDDLILLADVFETVDRDRDGILQPAEFNLFRRSLAATSAQWLFEVDEVSDGESMWQEGVDPHEWVSFHVAAISAFGRAQWRPALESVAAVCRVARTETPIEEPWVVCLASGGDIMSSWFSRAEMQPNEKTACRALRDASGWRCMSCEAEAFNLLPVRIDRSTSVIRVGLDVQPEIVVRRTTEGATGARLATKPFCTEPEKRYIPNMPENRCSTLDKMLSHRAMRPLRKRIQIGDFVIIESVKGTAKEADVGERGRVTEIYIPEHAVVKEDWCRLLLVEANDLHPKYDVVVPLRSVTNLKVDIRPGDTVQTYRPLVGGRRHGERSREAHNGTVLRQGRHRHLFDVSFGPHDEASVPLSWVLRLEMSAWTQVLRQAPRSTLFFLIYDLGLMPESREDRRELDDRMRRDFEPHGRCEFLNIAEAERGALRESRKPSLMRNGSSASVNSKASTRFGSTLMAPGDRGKIVSFDCSKMEAVVMPDRKKHLRVTVALRAMNPDCDPLPVAATGGTTTMHVFPGDSDLMAAVKQIDARTVRGLLSKLRLDGVEEALLEDSADADGNTLFHAAVCTKSEEIWRALWTAVTAHGTVADAYQALSAVNDWGRSPLWVALENCDVRLMGTLLKCGANANQEAPVLFGHDSSETRHGGMTRSTHDFCAGPGLVEEDAEFEARFFTPSCGLKFGPGERRNSENPSSATYVVVRSFGEAASQCIMPGDVLLMIGDQPAASYGTFRQLQARLDTAPRPLTLVFQKGNGLYIRPLHSACEQGRHNLVNLLLEHSADLTWRDLCGRSAMDRAVRLKNRQTAKNRQEDYQHCIDALVEYGASEDGRVTVLDADGNHHAFEHPSHWRFCRQMSLEGRFWLNIEEEPPGDVVDHLQRVVDKSIGHGYYSKKASKDRRGRLVPDRIIVEHVQRIENVASLREYLQRRFLLMQSLSRSPHKVEQVDDVKVKVNYSVLAGEDVACPLAAEVNEVYLFHGTSPESASGIAREDFLLELAGSINGDAFGRGIYFAEDCLKADEYTSEAGPDHRFAGLRPMLLCRVMLGRLVTSEEKDLSWEISEIMRGRYESLCADRRSAVGTYREFVIFDQDQANAEYILWYRCHTAA